MPTAWIGLGSDLGARHEHLRRALGLLAAAGVPAGRVSSLYLTEPVGDPDLPWFRNAVARVETRLPARALLRACLEIEGRCGRTREGPTPRPRTVDLDLLLYDGERIEGPDVQVPHPRMHERLFVLRPLAELDPDLVHPRLGRSMADLLGELPPAEGVWLLAPPAWAEPAIADPTSMR